MTLEELFNKYGPMVIRRCRTLVRDEQVALDLSQEVFMKIWEKWDTLQLDYPSSLLYTTATNLSLNYIRDNKKFTDSDSVLEQIACFDDQAADTEHKSLLNHIFGKEKSSKDQVSTRTIATLHFVDGFTLEETAREVGMSVSGIRKRLRLLKESIQELEVDYV